MVTFNRNKHNYMRTCADKADNPLVCYVGFFFSRHAIRAMVPRGERKDIIIWDLQNMSVKKTKK